MSRGPTYSPRRWLPVAMPVLIATFVLVSASPGQARTVPMLGFNEQRMIVPGANGVEQERAARLISATGASSVRLTIPWKSVQPSPGIWIWEPFDSTIEVLRRFGLRPQFMIEEAPAWATGIDCTGRSCPPADAHLGAWGTFARRVAERYGDAVAIEIWNGINWKGHWNTLGGPNPEVYARMFSAAADQIRRARPKMPVLIGGLAASIGRDAFLGTMTPTTYLRRFYAALDRRALRPRDGMGTFVLFSPPDIRKLKQQLSTHLGELRAAIRRHDPGRSIWITEAGSSTTGERGVSPALQSRVIETVLDTLRRARDIGAVAIHRLVERPHRKRPREIGYGVIRDRSYEPKPAYCRLVARVVGPLDEVGCAGRGRPYFGIRKVRRHKTKGRAKLIVQAPGPGKLVLERSRKVKPVTKKPGKARKVRLAIRPRGRARKRLSGARGSSRPVRVGVRARVTFDPDHAGPTMIAKRVRLVRRPR